jgi:hypothetical protein
MGMFQAQNYGNDFIGAMSATSNMLNNNRMAEMAEMEHAEKLKRSAGEAETRTLTNQGLTLDNQKKTAELDREKLLQGFLPRADALLKGQLDPKEQAALAGTTEELMKLVPYAPSRVEEIPDYRKKLGTLIQGVESIRSLPPSNYVYSRSDNVPEINNLLDNYQGVLSQERLGKTFTDPDGSITGKAGGSYTTTAVGGFMMASGEGNKAGFVPLFSVAGADGKPLMKQDGRPVLVPATEGATNGPQDNLRVVTPEELLTKAGFAYKLMDVADTLGLSDPEKRKAYVSGQLNSYRGEDGAKALAKSLEPKERKVKSVDPTHNLVDEETGKVILAGTPKEKEDKAPARNEYEKDGYKITEEYVGNGKWKEVGRNKIRVPKDPADPSIAENKRQETQSKAAIDKTIDAVNAAKSRLAAAKKADPESQDTKDAAQELEDAKTAYLNRTKEHKDSYGRTYNPIKEVVERKQARDTTPLSDGFADEGGVFSGRDYPTFIAQAERKGWTKAEIITASKGTNGEAAVNEYYAAKPQAAPAKGMKQGAAPSPKKTQLANNDTRPPLSAFMKRKP